MNGPCAKATVRCTIITRDGERIIGENWCANPQSVCPRQPGEDYTKCKTVCGQEGHAEIVAVRLAGEKARGARAYLEGHTYACMECQHSLFGAGVVSLSVGAPPTNIEDCSSLLKESLRRAIFLAEQLVGQQAMPDDSYESEFAELRKAAGMGIS